MAKKVIRKNMVDQVCEILLESIRNGDYAVGDKLPSENDLAEEFGTSRLTVRLAIQKLNAMELLETKVGEGTYVKAFNYEQYINNVSEIIFSQEMMRDIKDFRMYVEKGAAVLAAQNRTEEELSELKTLCMEYEGLYQNRKGAEEKGLWKRLARKDYEIHLKVCEMSHNELFRLTYLTMKNIMIDYMEEIIRSRKKRYEKNNEEEKFAASLTTHRKLYDAILRQDGSASSDVIENMVNYEILMPDSFLA